MCEISSENIYSAAKRATKELCEAAALQRGQIVIVGCSSSEIVGERIGKGSSLQAAQAVFRGIFEETEERGIFLAAQCCEHLNRALIVERACAEKYGLEIVCVKPQPHAGGSFASTAYENFSDPVAVEAIKAHAGMDIGGTLIGMHLKRVAVPVRLSVSKIGQANVLFARTRPAYIGGPRAIYPTDQA